MPKPSTHDPIDERLAAFADSLLAGEQPGFDPDPELRGLQQAVSRLPALAGSDPEPAQAARILRNVRRAARTAPRPQPAWRSWARGLSIAAMAAVLWIAAMLLPSGDQLSGAAGSISPFVPAGMFLLVVLAAGLIFWLRRKK